MATRAAAGKGNRAKGTAKNPTVAVDLAVLAVLEGDDGPYLGVLEVKREGGGWSLPGVYLEAGERLGDAAKRALTERTGLRGAAPRQLHTLDPSDRDDREWVVTVAYVVGLTEDQIGAAAAGTRVVPAESPGRLAHGHGEVVSRALEELRARYAYAPDPDGFLPQSFTLRELRLVHEAVAGYELQRDTFRRTMEPQLVTTGEVTVGGRGRPAELFARA